MTSITVTLPPETERKLREKAGAAGVTLEVYLRQLAEKDAGNGTPSPTSPTFEEMTGPLARALGAAGMSEQELGDFFAGAVKEFRAEKQARK
jgi:hypothetical protein